MRFWNAFNLSYFPVKLRLFMGLMNVVFWMFWGEFWVLYGVMLQLRHF
jgi:hypothetical protein